MKLNFLGKGAAFYPAYGNTGAYMLDNKDLYLLDCGESAFHILHQKGLMDEAERVYVIVTHLHADHIGSLGSLISYFYCVRKKPVFVIHPERTLVDLLRLQGISDAGYRYLERLPENAAGLSAEPVEVSHVPDMKCYGYLLTDREGCIYYSGDAAKIPKEVLKAFLQGQIDRIYQDTSTHEEEHPTHCYYQILEGIIPANLRDRIFCMHLDGPFEQRLMDCGFRVVEVGDADEAGEADAGRNADEARNANRAGKE